MSNSTRSRPNHTPIRLKITLPYVTLAVLFATLGVYLLGRVVLESITDRFNNQLTEAGQLTEDWFVQQENDLLNSLRLLAFTDGVADSVVTNDAETLREIMLPIAISGQEDAIEILNPDGVSVMSVRHVIGGTVEEYESERGADLFQTWPFVQKVLNQETDAGGDKFGGIVTTPWGTYFYVAGPINDSQGNLMGVVLVGRLLDDMLAEIRANTLAQITLYQTNGTIISSTFPPLDTSLAGLGPNIQQAVTQNQATRSVVRRFQHGSLTYSEILSPWTVRGETAGYTGVALSELFIVSSSRTTQLQIILVATIGLTMILAFGIYIANGISIPLLNVVQASKKVAAGDLDVQISENEVGTDEVATLAAAFNKMVTELREGAIYRDILGRTVSPAVRDQLRNSFSSGSLNLQGQNLEATALMTDIRGFTTIMEQMEARNLVTHLNDYFATLIEPVIQNNGVVSDFAGDAIFAYFGVLPQPLPPSESAYLACRAAAEIISTINQFNANVIQQNQSMSEPLPQLMTGVGVTSGVVTAGALGHSDRLHYAVLGDTVNTAARLESLTKMFNATSAVISQTTYDLLGNRRSEFHLEFNGYHSLKGKTQQIGVYRLYGYRHE